ncbi:MAG TPA: hypothetical protein VI636_13950 [Candidatus Angelobacter sp.]
MERRRKPASRSATNSLDQNAGAKGPTIDPGAFPNLAELIAYGEITIGVLRPVGCVAVANDGHNSLAMLQRRRGESFIQLLTRLDSAVDKALTEEIFTDEINAKS